jgi:hypothetical protein
MSRFIQIFEKKLTNILKIYYTLNDVIEKINNNIF